MDDNDRLLVVAEATVARTASRLTRRQAAGIRTMSVLTRWRSQLARDESQRLHGELAHPATDDRDPAADPHDRRA